MLSLLPIIWLTNVQLHLSPCLAWFALSSLDYSITQHDPADRAPIPLSIHHTPICVSFVFADDELSALEGFFQLVLIIVHSLNESLYNRAPLYIRHCLQKPVLNQSSTPRTSNPSSCLQLSL